MGEETAISWCHHTFNPWWGCQRVSEACRNCYAERLDNRFANETNPAHWGPDSPRKFFGDKHWADPLKWNKAAVKAGLRRRVFCASMADVFEARADLVAHRLRLLNVILQTKSLDWLLLTKRPENIMDMMPPAYRNRPASPWPNVWLGVTAENNAMAEERILTLRGIPAAVRFVSCEPILEPIGADTWDLVLGPRPGLEPVHWLIIGDESGHGARPAQVEWIRTARDAALRHNVRFHFKQWQGRVTVPGIHGSSEGASGKKIHLPVLDGRQWAEFPARPWSHRA